MAFQKPEIEIGRISRISKVVRDSEAKGRTSTVSDGTRLRTTELSIPVAPVVV